MIASHVTRETLELAAREVGVVLDMDAMSASGRRFRVKVNPGARWPILGPRGGKRGMRHKYQRISASYFNQGRRVWAVCWHGFRDFFRAVYDREPGAIFRTALDTWKGSEDFEARFPTSGHKDIGAPIAPIAWCEACECGEEGLAE